MNTTMNWYQKTVGDDSVNAVATKAALVQSTLNRQVAAGRLPAESVIAIARAYSVSAVQALVHTGHLTNADVAHYRRVADIASFSDREIADEVWKRMVEGHLDADGEPALSVIEDINSGGAEPLAALQSRRNEEFERREE